MAYCVFIIFSTRSDKSLYPFHACRFYGVATLRIARPSYGTARIKPRTPSVASKRWIGSMSIDSGWYPRRLARNQYSRCGASSTQAIATGPSTIPNRRVKNTEICNDKLLANKKERKNLVSPEIMIPYHASKGVASLPKMLSSKSPRGCTHSTYHPVSAKARLLHVAVPLCTPHNRLVSTVKGSDLFRLSVALCHEWKNKGTPFHFHSPDSS